MNIAYSVRAKAGLAVLILFALLTEARLLKQTIALDPSQIGRDGLTLYEKRFEGLKVMLPPHGVVGYISDVQPDQVLVDADATAHYYVAQYALSPVVLDNSYEHPLVVGNFHAPLADSAVISAIRNMTLRKDFGQGVILFSREDK